MCICVRFRWQWIREQRFRLTVLRRKCVWKKETYVNHLLRGAGGDTEIVLIVRDNKLKKKRFLFRFCLFCCFNKVSRKIFYEANVARTHKEEIRIQSFCILFVFFYCIHTIRRCVYLVVHGHFLPAQLISYHRARLHEFEQCTVYIEHSLQ